MSDEQVAFAEGVETPVVPEVAQESESVELAPEVAEQAPAEAQPEAPVEPSAE